MKTSDLSFDLPPELVAQEPSAQRGESRLLVAERHDGTWQHCRIPDIVNRIEPGTVMVFNDSRVRRARVFGTSLSASAREQEFLLLNQISDTSWRVIGSGSRRLRSGRTFLFAPGSRDERTAEVTAEDPPFRVLTFSAPIDDRWLDQHGHMPLPPYIHRADAPEDAERYQTVYARVVGSVAAPTAGLHFTTELIETLRERGVVIAFVTLHVGIGTFLPVRTETLEDHRMHSEEFFIPEETARAIANAREQGKPVLAVGTTAVRTLEAQGRPDGTVISGSGSTEIFITPGYQFKVVNQLFTNFHTPGSTLIALVSAFAGSDHIKTWYAEAIRQRYRFFSYGDAMLIR